MTRYANGQAAVILAECGGKGESVSEGNSVVRGFGYGFGGCFGCAGALIVGVLIGGSILLHPPSTAPVTYESATSVTEDIRTAPPDRIPMDRDEDNDQCNAALAEVHSKRLVAVPLSSIPNTHMNFGPSALGCYASSPSGGRYRIMYSATCGQVECVSLVSVFAPGADKPLWLSPKFKSGHRAR
jgi:hypothetical protein